MSQLSYQLYKRRELSCQVGHTIEKMNEVTGSPVQSYYCYLWVILFLTTLCDRPSKVVMWAYACLQIYYQNRKHKVDLSVLSEFFPIGFPTEEAVGECWDAQKDKDSLMGNYLDNEIAWTSTEGEKSD